MLEHLIMNLKHHMIHIEIMMCVVQHFLARMDVSIIHWIISIWRFVVRIVVMMH